MLRRMFTIALFGLVYVSPAFAQLVVRPTTTLTLETGNNTSAANSFSTSSNGNLGSGNISKVPVRTLLYPGATMPIYTHVVPWWGKSGHISIGYSSQERAQVRRQVNDMVSRGLDGVVVDWYGPTSFEDLGSKLFMWEAEEHSGFDLIIELEHGAVTWHSCYPGCDVTTAVIELTGQISQRFLTSPAYLRHQGRPVLMEFGMEVLPSAVDWNKVQAAYPDIIWIHRNPPAFTQPKTGGGFAWWDSRTPDKLTSGYDSSGYLDYFYKVAAGYPNLQAYGSVFKGFDDSLASWSPAGGRHIYQACGQTWLKTFSMLNKWYSASKPLHALQLNTWNDYEEGSELETGIDNCLSISASMQNAVLNWNVQGQENTIHHYTVFISTDGENLMPLGDFTPGARNLNLASFELPSGKYSLYVKAVGQPLIRNHMSAAVSYTVQSQLSSGSSGSTKTASADSAQSSLASLGETSTTPAAPPVSSNAEAASVPSIPEAALVPSTPEPASVPSTPEATSVSSAAKVNVGLSPSTLSAAPATPSVPSAVKLNMGLSPSTLKVKRGSAAQVKISLGGSGSSENVTLSCSDLPVGVTCSFFPKTVLLDSNGATAVLTVSAKGRSVARIAPFSRPAFLALLTPGMGIFGVVIGGFGSTRRRIAAALLIFLVVSLVGCGTGGTGTGFSPQKAAAAGNYSITVSATSTSSPQASSLPGSAVATLMLE